MSSTWASRTVSTPVGRMWMVTRDDKLWSAELEPRWSPMAVRASRALGETVDPAVRFGRSRALTDAERRLARYFRGELNALDDVPLDLEGSAFLAKVWRTVRRVRPGRTLSYAALAKRVGKDGAFRAVGSANARNPCALFVPCHRIVSSSGGLTGYGGGIRAKAFLLSHEGVPVEGARLAD